MKSAILLSFFVVFSGAVSPMGYAQDEGASFHVAAGVATEPAYAGSSHYVAQPVYDAGGSYRNATWGTFELGVLQGARWQLPLSSPLGVALLMAYDAGRDERIRTLGGHNTQLRGMGDLGGALEAGAELSYQFAPARVYVKGMQALRSRDYGDEALGHTAYVDLGVDGEHALDAQWTLSSKFYATWANGGYQRGYFGVTPAQAARTDFAAYHPKSGIRQVTAEAALNYQWTSSVALQGGVQVYRLTGDAADSPLVEKNLAGMAFLSASYRF